MLDTISYEIRKNIALSIKCGFDTPEMQIITNDLDHYLSDPRWNVEDNIALQVPSDIIFDYCLYYDGEFKDPIIFINDTHLLSGGMGATLPANLVTAIPGKVPVKQLAKLRETIQEFEKDYKGYVTIRFSLYKKRLYFQRISFRLIPDYLYNIVNLCGYEDVDSYLLDFSNGTLNAPSGISVSMRIYTYPYIPEDNKEVVKSFSEDYNLIELEDCFLVTGYSKKVHIKDAWSDLYSIINNPYIKHAGVCYNTDGGEFARKVWAELQKSRLIK